MTVQAMATEEQPPAPDGLVVAFERLFELDPDERRHLEAVTAVTETVEPRRKLTVEGRPCASLFVVKSGWLYEAREQRDGRRQILSIRLPGDLVGLECLAYCSALHSTVALTRCTVAPLPMARFEAIQRDFPRLATALFLMTLRESATLHEWEVNLGRRVAVPRVAHLLMELNHRVRRRGLAGPEGVPFPLTQEDLADATGLTPGYVNRVLQLLRRRDLVRLDERTLHVLDVEALGRLAGFRADYIERWGGGGSALGAPG